ncbi:hypothetical protein A2368_01435 [Candidatus Collierbacteria bacterium RIFOXYB1_FULL_49_13]|uniref:Uncharacterized protein n=1 Tax=Candidatus Collierbacteria bacterium RIFOXYB1_FULL_49_13 TaxID=1817728 RepID=A0A1F5FG98_9BACT|nr:MAG: hypothetical protein A2368_01435 [Candidatus Collierbacteria bacterium RIFOXYB1_FULL_49_13]
MLGKKLEEFINSVKPTRVVIGHQVTWSWMEQQGAKILPRPQKRLFQSTDIQRISFRGKVFPVGTIFRVEAGWSPQFESGLLRFVVHASLWEKKDPTVTHWSWVDYCDPEAFGYDDVVVDTPEPVLDMPIPLWMNAVGQYGEDAYATTTTVFLSEARQMADEFRAKLAELGL